MIKWVRKFFRGASFIVFCSLLVCILGAGAFALIVIGGLPDVSKLKDFSHSVSTEVYSADGIKIGEFTTQRRYPVAFDQIPKHVIQAFIAAEDSNFYEHSGIDFRGILRAIGTNILAGRYKQGASTITQQVARSILLSREKKLIRKIREMILARRMEDQLSKNEILSLYLSEIYLGHGSYGIGAAARSYFHKEVEDLTLAEAALLAGLPQRPAKWDPFKNPKAAKKRQIYALKRMLTEGYITREEVDQAFEQPITLFPVKDLNNEVAPYFTEYVRTYLMGKYGGANVLSRGYKVYTTVRHQFQKEAERAVDVGLRRVDKRMGWRGPVQQLTEPSAREAFLAENHRKILSEASPARILKTRWNTDDISEGSDEPLISLEVDTSSLEDAASPYFGETPLKLGENYDAVVSEMDPEAKTVVAKVGRTDVEITFTSMEWVKIDGKPVESPDQFLSPGDVVQIKVKTIDRVAKKVQVDLEQQPEVQGALLAYEVDTGFVTAMVGGTDFRQSQFNRALQSKRQVGSTFKPLVYAGAIDKGYSPSSIVTDSPVIFRNEASEEVEVPDEYWKPRNYGQKFVGELPLRLALTRSKNIPTIKVMDAIGVDYAIEYARTLGITAPLPRDLTIALGSWSSSLDELMKAYSIFPRLGRPIALTYIQKVTDSEGEVLEEFILPETASRQGPILAGGPDRSPPGEGLVISPQTAYVMTDMLKAVIREGTGWRAAGVSRYLAGKTGTSNDFHDAWFIGYSPHIMAGVWVGYDRDKALKPGEAGGKAAAPIFADFMQGILKSYPNEDFVVPDDIVFAYVDKKSGQLANPRSADRRRVAFKVGTVPNSSGDNLLRIPEPGVRGGREMGAERSFVEDPGAIPEIPSTGQQEDDDISDFLREGYQE